MQAQIKDCGHVSESEKSIRTTIKEAAAIGERAHFFQSPVRLVHKTAGYEVGGAAMRLTTDAYGVLFTMNHAGAGQWFKTLAEAQVKFEQLTGK